MTSCDVLVMLQRRNLEHVIDRILSYLGALSQMSLALSSSSHHQLVINNKVARKKISAWRRWMRRDPTTGTLFDKEGSIVTSLSVLANSVAFCLQDFTESSSSICVMDLDQKAPPSRVLVADYPLSLHSLSCSEELLVFLTVHHVTQCHVNVLCRRTKTRLSQFNPHPGHAKVTSLKLEGHLLVSGSESGSIVLTSLQCPSQPSTTHEISASDAAVLDLSLQHFRIVSLSQDSAVRVWTTEADLITTISAENKNLSKMSVSWPFCIIAGLDIVLLWDLERGHQLQTLHTASGQVPSVLSINRHLIVVGDLTGSLSIWSLQDLTDGHSSEENKTRNTLKCLDMQNVISGVCILSGDKILLTGWNGKCCLLSF